MVELAIGGNPDWEVCDLEFRRSGVSYTVDTLRELKRIYPPPHELFFIAGADSLQELEKWKEPEEILRLSEWIVAPRPLFKSPRERGLPARVHLLRMPPVAISASELRERIEKGENISEWIPEKVRHYMEKMNVYGRKR